VVLPVFVFYPLQNEIRDHFSLSFKQLSKIAKKNSCSADILLTGPVSTDKFSLSTSFMHSRQCDQCDAQCLFQLTLILHKKSKCGLMWSVLLSTTSTRHHSCKTFCLYCFCTLSEFVKVFERKVWYMQVTICIMQCMHFQLYIITVVKLCWCKTVTLSFLH